MGKKLDACLGRTFKGSKFKHYVNLAIPWIAFLEKQHRGRYEQARSDVINLLKLGHKERALLRVEHVIREQNLLDAYVMIEDYFHLLMERIVVLNDHRKCPDELKEAISSLVFAASRFGELPELQKISRLFTSRYGKEFEMRVVQLRNNCGVNPKIVKKLSTQTPSLDSKLKMLKEVDPMHDISNMFEGGSSTITNLQKKMDTQEGKLHNYIMLEAYLNLVNLSERNTGRWRKYGDAESAAQAAYKFAADAAEAARAAVEMARLPRNDLKYSPSSCKQESKVPRNGDENKKGNLTNEKESERFKMTELGNLLNGLSSESKSDSYIYCTYEKHKL